MAVSVDLQSGNGDNSHPPTSLVVKQCVVVGCCFLLLLNVLGFMAGLGVLFVDILDTFQSSRATGSLIQAVCMGIVFGTGAVASHVIAKVGAGRVCVIGGVVAAAGLVGSAFAPNLPVLIVAVGVVTGLGLCTTSMVPLIIVGDMFNSRRNLALTVVSIGPGVGALVFPVLNSLLVGQFGWRGAFLILGGVMLQATPIGLILSVVGEDIRCYNKRTRRLPVESNNGHALTDQEHVDYGNNKVCVEDGKVPHHFENEEHFVEGSHLEAVVKEELDSMTSDPGREMTSYLTDKHDYVNTAFTDDTSSKHDKTCSFNNVDAIGSIEVNEPQNGNSLGQNNEIVDNVSLYNEEKTGSDVAGSTFDSVPNVEHNNDAKWTISTKEKVNFVCADEHIYDNQIQISVGSKELDNGSCFASQTSHHRELAAVNGKPLGHQQQNNSCANSNNSNNTSRPAQDRFKSFLVSLHLEMFKDITFNILAMNVVLITAMFPSINFFLVDMTIAKGFDAQTGSLLLSLIGFCNLAGRFLYLFLRPFFKVTQIMIFATLGVLISLSVLLLAWATTLPFLLGAVVCYGLPFGAVSVSYPSLMFEIAGPQKYAIAVGYSETLSGVGALIGGPIAGSLKDWSDSYNSVVYGATAAGLLCSVSFYAVLMGRRCGESK